MPYQSIKCNNKCVNYTSTQCSDHNQQATLTATSSAGLHRLRLHRNRYNTRFYSLLVQTDLILPNNFSIPWKISHLPPYITTELHIKSLSNNPLWSFFYHVAKFNAIPHFQFTKKRKHSISDVLFILNNVLLSKMNNNISSTACPLDIQKAFDSGRHEELIYNMLNIFSFQSQICKLLLSYVENRTPPSRFHPVLDGTLSNRHPCSQFSSLISLQ